ncbi:hypothetical protein HanXRQr2_Chr13g0606421 [Helianthus annuus]|uniref:Uncharacterized protein n=1 Tax=Helianthus annuus TaxID=4232 RepID=A0A9K3EKJ4_HELAN|nr:hypothetical protein HanXRQr2_Chr13g0606421 [Helianthus annuus]KAJ0850766.1 hypothetical protein HanPSC8_Chr13g0584671 [Helianthus annuus]
MRRKRTFSSFPLSIRTLNSNEARSHLPHFHNDFLSKILYWFSKS